MQPSRGAVRPLIRPAVALGAMLVMALALQAPGVSAANVERANHRVEAQGTFPVYRWDPSEITVAAGDKVTWVNTTDSEHHVTPYEGPWAERDHLHVVAGKKVSFRFKQPGTYRYYCDLQFHGQLVGPLCIGQCGTVVVE